MSGSHASDEGTSPKTDTRLSVATGTSERPGDQTFHTEEWVRVSDFDVGTPTSTTAKSDYDAAAEESYGDVRAQDKLVDWETVNAGNSSSAEDIGEVVVEYSSGSGQNKLDKVLSDSTDKEDEDAKSVSSKSSSSSSSTVHSPAASFPKKSDSSIVVVPSHEDESQESSFASVDDYPGIVAHFSSPEQTKEEVSEHQAIEPVSESDEQEEENYEPFDGVEEQAISTIEPVSSEEEEEDKYRLFTDVSNLKDLLEQEESSGGDPSARYDSFSSFLSSRMNTVESEAQDSSEVTPETPGVLKEEHPQLEMEVPEQAKVAGPEVKESGQQVVEEAIPDNLQGGNIVEDFAESIEPTTPEKASSENPYTFERSISDEEAFEAEYSSPSKEKQAAPSEKSQEVDENIAKESQDAGVPEPDQHELNQLLEIAHSKEISHLGKQEEKLLAQEEQDLGKAIVEPQPLVEVLSATDDPKPLEGGELKDLQPVATDEAPLLKDSPAPVVSGFQVEAELKDKAPELFNKESEDGLHEETNAAFGDEHQSVETLVADLSSQMEEPLAGKEGQNLESKIQGDSSSVDHVLRIQIEELSTKNEDATLVPLGSIHDSKNSTEFTKDLGVTSLAGDVEGTREISRSSEKSEQVAITPHRKIEVSSMPNPCFFPAFPVGFAKNSASSSHLPSQLFLQMFTQLTFSIICY